MVQSLASELTWRMATEEKVVYLTFDDGPHPTITDAVLDILKSYDALATFFCIGGNVQAQPAVYERIVTEGHAVGNHTWNHMSGWNFTDFSYFKNVLECNELVDSKLFRPPYGQIKPSQIRGLSKRYDIVMWDVLSADWSSDVAPEKCLSNVLDNASSGSIVVFHDSDKAEKNMLYALPRALERLSAKGYSFKALSARLSNKSK